MSELWPTSEVKRKMLLKAMERVGLELEEAGNHTNVVQVHTGLLTQIPRHRIVKKELAREIVRYVIEKMDIPEHELREALKTTLSILPMNKR